MKKNNKIDESLLRDRSKKQLQNLKKTIDASGGDIESKVRKGSKYKENKIPNTIYMDNPFGSKREIDTWENFSKNDANNKSIAAASTQPSNIKKLSRFTDFKKRGALKESMNEAKKFEFDVDKPVGKLEELFIDLHESPENYDINKDGFDKLYKLMSKYDLEETNDVLVTFRKMSDNDKKEALSLIGSTEDMIENAFNNTVYESKNDEELYLTPKQRKLPEGLKKGIIKKMKKSGKKLNDKKDKEECNDCDNDKKDKKKDKKNDINKSDEEKYLTPKQRKLPDGLKKGIINKAKKSSKINESVDISDQLTEEDVEGSKQIESPNGFFNRYELKDGRIIDVAPSGKMILVSDNENFDDKKNK